MRHNLPVRYSSDLYDSYTADHLQAWDAMLIGRMVRERPPGDGTILDVGTGTAQLLVKAAAVPELDGMRFVGIDLFEDMVAKARQTVLQHGIGDRIEIEQGDVHALPFPSDRFEMVISRSTIHHWADPAAAFREIYRVLKPGGVALIHDVRRDPGAAALETFEVERSRAGVPPTILEEKYTREEVRSFLALAGIERNSLIIAPKTGPGSLGFEVRIQKLRGRFSTAPAAGS